MTISINTDTQNSTVITPRRCQIVDGKIRPPISLELIVSDHCNIACRQCNHASPIMKKWNVDPDEVFEELSTLAAVYRPIRVKIIGGEPILHPRLHDVLLAVRRSGISHQLVMITNGLLLNRISDEVWRELDEIEISRYPNSGLKDETITTAKKKGWKFNTKLTLSDFSDFRHTFSGLAIKDSELTKKIFAGCKIANVWGCHALYQGHIFRCPQSIYAPKIASNDFFDGLELDRRPNFQQRLLTFLNSDHPLQSCSHCVGTNGRKISHELVHRSKWSDDMKIPPEEMIDYQLLEKSLIEISDIDDCRVPVKPKLYSVDYFRNKTQSLQRKLQAYRNPE